MSATALAEAMPMAAEALRFGDVLDAIDLMPMEDQEQIVEIVRRRLSLARREQLVQEVLEAEREYAEGRCKAATIDEIMKDILS